MLHQCSDILFAVGHTLEIVLAMDGETDFGQHVAADFTNLIAYLALT